MSILDRAVMDLALTRTQVVVFFQLARRLDYVDHRPIKPLALAAEIGIPESTISSALRGLVARGYLERGPRDEATGSWTYRVPFSPTPRLPTRSTYVPE